MAKMQRINPGNIDPMQMNNYMAMMGIANSIQKIGKGKRKYEIDLESGEKKFLGKFINEVIKQFESPDGKANNVEQFLMYASQFCSTKGRGKLKLSYEEYDFMKRLINESVRGMANMKLPWYSLIKRVSVWLMSRQYATISKKFA